MKLLLCSDASVKTKSGVGRKRQPKRGVVMFRKNEWKCQSSGKENERQLREHQER